MDDAGPLWQLIGADVMSWPSTNTPERFRNEIASRLEAMPAAQAHGLARQLERLDRAFRAADIQEVRQVEEDLAAFMQVATSASGLLAEIGNFKEQAPAPEEGDGVCTYCITTATLAEAYGYLS